LLLIRLHAIFFPKAWNLCTPVRHCSCCRGFADDDNNDTVLESSNADETQEEICVLAFASMKNIFFFFKLPSDQVSWSLTMNKTHVSCNLLPNMLFHTSGRGYKKL